MPQVPLYNSPQIQEQGLRTPQTSAPDVAAGTRAFGAALGQVSDTIYKVAQRDAEAEANKVDTEITAGWLAWDAQARKQYQGQNVDEYQAKAAEWWDQARKDHAGTISPLARERVGAALGRKQNQAMASVLGHVGAEKERFADTQSEAAAQTTIDFALDTGDTAGAAQRVRQLVAEKGARKGWTTEMVQADQQRLLGNLHLSYITQLAETDATKARQYYDANKGEIPGTAQARVEQVLKGEADNQFATQFAAQRADKPLSEQLKDASEISDPQRREKALQQVRNNHAMVEAAKREQQQAATDKAWAEYVDKGRRVPEVLRMQMGESNLRELLHFEDARARQAVDRASGKGVKTDPNELAKVYDMMRDDPEAFKKLRMATLTTKFAPSDIEQVSRIQRDMLDPTKQKDALTLAQQVGAVSRGLSKTQREQFEPAAYDEILKFQEQNNRPPNAKERKQILDELLIEATIEGGGYFGIFDAHKPVYQMTPEEKASAKFPQQKAAAQSGTEKFTVGKVYVDGRNNRAKYLGNGKWEPIQ